MGRNSFKIGCDNGHKEDVILSDSKRNLLFVAWSGSIAIALHINLVSDMIFILS